MRSFILCANMIFLLIFAAAKIEAKEVSLFEKTYVRESGSPIPVSDTFSEIYGLVKIRVTNGGIEDADSVKVSSSKIALNGEVIIHESDFKKNAGVIEVEKKLSGGTNTIAVTLKGKPGGVLTVQVFTEAASVDMDGDGFTENDGDCDDANSMVNPGAAEIPNNSMDDDCDPSTPDDGGVALPPDPGEEGRLTLLGIDSDGDGVRDDIQRYIHFTYPDDEDKKLRLALTCYARELQGVLADANDREAAYEHATKMARHGECLFYLKGRDSINIRPALNADFIGGQVYGSNVQTENFTDLSDE